MDDKDYTGKVIDVAIWEHELTAEEIHSLANGVNKESQALLDEAQQLWRRTHDIMSIPFEMPGVRNRRREAVMATRAKHGK